VVLFENVGYKIESNINVKFKDAEEFLEFFPDDELKITLMLRKIVFDCLPNCTEKISYNAPFYKIHKHICFIWPASVLWGNSKTYEGVRFGFNKGFRLNDELKYLNKGDRKQVYWRDFKSIKEIDVDLLKTYLFEAAVVDSKM